MTEFKEHTEVKIGSERSFGIVFTVALAIIACLPLLHGGEIRLWLLPFSGAFLAAAVIRPGILAPLNHLWFKFGLLLGRIIAPLVMSLVFLVAVTPTGLLMRLFGKDPMHRKFDKTTQSYWRRRGEDDQPMGSMKNQF